MTIVVKVLQGGKPAAKRDVKISYCGIFGGQKTRATDYSGIVAFTMSPGEYNVYVSGRHVGRQYLKSHGENVFHI